jgi:prevent-host-death family protein
MTKTVTAAELAANLATMLEEVARNGEEVLITNEGEPLAKLVSTRGTRTDQASSGQQGVMLGTIRIVGDIVEPIEPLDTWECERD